MKLFLAVIYCFFLFSGISQIQFYKQYSNNGYDSAEGIVQLPDNNYLITGSSSSFLDGPAQAFLMKIDSLGGFKWSKHYGGSESEGGRRVMHIPNDGNLIAGFTNSSGAGAYDFYLIKTDLLGNPIWENTYGTSGWERVYDAALTKDSGVIMVGETTLTVDGQSDIYIVRTDKNGVELWNQQIGQQGTDIARTIDQIDDSTFAIGGTIYSEDSLMNKGFLARIQDNGAVLWQREFGAVGHHDITELTFAENNINGVGFRIKETGDTSVITFKFNLSGSQLLYQEDGSSGLNYGSGICKFGPTDKYCVAVTSDNQYSYGGLDVNFATFYNVLYWEEWRSGVNFLSDEFLGELISTSDLGAIAVGRITETAQGGASIYVLKMLSNGPFINSTGTTTYTSIVSVPENLSKNSSWKVYPNPASDQIIIASDHLKPQTIIQLTNNLGEVILKTEATQLFECKIDVSTISKGIYYLLISNENENLVERIVIN